MVARTYANGPDFENTAGPNDRPVTILSDRPIDRAVMQNVGLTPQPWEPSDDYPLWVVEHSTSVDSLAEQEEAVLAGRPVLVCSFLRTSLAAIGPCRDFIGSIASVSAVAGLPIHCERDIARAARELRGRLAAQSVTVWHNGHLLIVRADGRFTDGVEQQDVRGQSLWQVIRQLTQSDVSSRSVA